MQVVSSTFSGAMNSPWRELTVGAGIAWEKTINPNVGIFTIGTSVIGGPDIIATSAPGTPAQAQQYLYQNVPASGIVSWQTSIKLDQYPYGVVQRQADLVLDNTTTAYLAASGTSLGPYIEPGRPFQIAAGFGERRYQCSLASQTRR